jgi:transcriptional regulator with XRE-family HTH domain
MTRTTKTLSEFIQKARIEAGCSQFEVARKLGYGSPQFISNWERGVSSPPCRALPVLAEIFGVSSHVLFEHLVRDTVARVEKSLEIEFESELRRYGSKGKKKTAAKSRN